MRAALAAFAKAACNARAQTGHNIYNLLHTLSTLHSQNMVLVYNSLNGPEQDVINCQKFRRVSGSCASSTELLRDCKETFLVL